MIEHYNGTSIQSTTSPVEAPEGTEPLTIWVRKEQRTELAAQAHRNWRTVEQQASALLEMALGGSQAGDEYPIDLNPLGRGAQVGPQRGRRRTRGAPVTGEGE